MSAVFGALETEGSGAGTEARMIEPLFWLTSTVQL